MKNKCCNLNISKRKVILLVVIAILVILIIMAVKGMDESFENVEFTVLSDDQIPQEIKSSVVPEYRDLERALACVFDGKVYVVVTRGEKPTSGFDIAIDRITLHENENDDTVMSVYANFTDPEQGNSISQILTYPMQVAETALTELPDKIELKVQYQK